MRTERAPALSRGQTSRNGLISEQRFSIALVRDDDLFVAKLRVDFPKREHHLISVMRLCEDVAGKGFAAKLPPVERRRA